MPSPSNDSAAAGLNLAQQEAVNYMHGPCLVLAGAGSGKTRVITHKIGRLIQAGLPPQEIAAITFTNKAAAEMRERAKKLIGQPARGVLICTFHALGVRMLRQDGEVLGLKKQFSILDSDDVTSILKDAGGSTDAATARQWQWTISAWKNSGLNAAQAEAQASGDEDRLVARIMARYEERLTAYQSVDFDDLIGLPLKLLREHDAVRDKWQQAMGHVLVDEYQDTNLLQAAILLALKPDGRGVTVVGDDAQSIYSFRGATVRNILDFPSQFSRPARVVTLERNYRSTQPILDVSNACIAHAAERHAKTLWTDKPSAGRPQIVRVPDESQQACWVADKVLAHREGGLALKSQAVLFRTSSHSAPLELELARRNIPFVKYGGLKFLEASHVKDLLAVLRFAQNPRGRMAGFRVTQLIPGIGPATSAKLLDAMDQAADPAIALRDFVPPSAARAEWAAFAEAYAALRAPLLAWPADVGIAMDWYLPHLERLYDDTAGTRRGDVEQLVHMASGYASRERFLTELTLDPPEATSDRPGPPLLDEDYLILSTIHSAKGQEWNSVHVLNVVDGCMPADVAQSAQELEEERRLLYVAMTRARDHLHLLVPQRFYIPQQAARGDRHLYANRSRFIPDADLARFEAQTWPPPPPRAPAVPPPAAVIDLRNRMRAAWR